MRSKPGPVLMFTALLAILAGVWAGNKLVARLHLDRGPDRLYFTTRLKALVTPDSAANLTLQNRLYQTRIDRLLEQRRALQSRIEAVQETLEPLEADVRTYRNLRLEKVRLSQDEQTRLYIDLVSRYRDYQRALTEPDSFVPLAEGDSLLAIPSIYRDLILRQGGEVAREHNRFLAETRDPSFAAGHEAMLRRFLADRALDTAIVECRRTLCELHLSGHWDRPYYRAFDALYRDLAASDGFDLTPVAGAHQYRGGGVQIQVWILEGGA